jgi:hypothetical protein
MESIPLENLHIRSAAERICDYIESIPDGHAVALVQALTESNVRGRKLWMETAGDCLITRYMGTGKAFFLVNSKTAKQLKKTS